MESVEDSAGQARGDNHMDVTDNSRLTDTVSGDAAAVPCKTESTDAGPCKIESTDAGPCKTESTDAGPCKRMKKGEGKKFEEEEDETDIPKIGTSGLYALAKSSHLDEGDLSRPQSAGICAKKTFSINKGSPHKSYDGDTKHLSSFRRLLHDVGGENINTNCNRIVRSGHDLKFTESRSDACSCQPSTSRFHGDTVAMETHTSSSSHSDDFQSPGAILPVSLLVNIFQYLSMSDLLCRASRVCRLWYQAAHDPSLWRHICLPVSSRVTDSVLNWLTSLSDRVLTLDVSDGKHTTFTDDGMIQILKKCHFIRKMKLARYFVFSDDVFESVGKFCHQVRHLNLDGCFSISDTSIISIGEGCPLLEYLYMSQCNRISDEGMLAVAKGCPRLKQLRIDQCVKVKDVSIKALVSGCPDLEYLHLLACSLTDDGLQELAKLSRLRMLDISNMMQLSSLCLEKIARSCKLLEVLSVSLNRTVDDEGIKTIVQSCVHLKCLSCVACNLTDKTLEYISQYSRTLERVDVAWCGEITDAGVQKISESCKSLRYLGLMRCGQVTMETVDKLIPLYPHIHYSNFVLESRKLLQRAKNDGHQVTLPFI